MKTILTAFLTVVGMSNACADEPVQEASRSTTDVTAIQRQRVYPVLIRNDHNPLLQLVIDSQQQSVFLYSVTFSLRGTDNPNDIESLQVLSTGDQENFSMIARFGNRQAAGDEVTFRGNLRLRKGKNALWLSCRLHPKANLDHKLDAACSRIVTSAGAVSPRDETPHVRQRIGVALRRHFDDGIHTYRIPALATTPQGTLLCVYDARRRRAKDLQEDIDIGMLRSSDGGQSWEPQRIIMDMGEYDGLPQEQNGCSDPGIIVDPATGEIFVFAVWTWGRPGTHQWSPGGSEPGFEIGKTAQFMMVRSRDDGQSWTKPENLTRKLKQEAWILFAPSPQQGMALSDGTLVMPVQGRNEKDIRFSTIMLSRDHGQSWSVQTPYPHNNTECQAVGLGDGSIMLNCRTEATVKYRTVIVTSDLGRSWQPHVTNRNHLIEPGCNGSLYRFDYRQNGAPKHLLLFANPHSQSGRHHHTIQVSFDDGTTWPPRNRLLLDEGQGRGYPTISRIDDQHVGIVYEGSRADLVFERLSLDELMENR